MEKGVKGGEEIFYCAAGIEKKEKGREDRPKNLHTKGKKEKRKATPLFCLLLLRILDTKRKRLVYGVIVRK